MTKSNDRNAVRVGVTKLIKLIRLKQFRVPSSLVEIKLGLRVTQLFSEHRHFALALRVQVEHSPIQQPHFLRGRRGAIVFQGGYLLLELAHVAPVILKDVHQLKDLEEGYQSKRVQYKPLIKSPKWAEKIRNKICISISVPDR